MIIRQVYRAEIDYGSGSEVGEYELTFRVADEDKILTDPELLEAAVIAEAIKRLKKRGTIYHIRAVRRDYFSDPIELEAG